MILDLDPWCKTEKNIPVICLIDYRFKKAVRKENPADIFEEIIMWL